MNDLKAAVWAEGIKIVRSKIFWITILAFSIMAVTMGFFMFVLKNPESLGTQIAIAEKADWPTYFNIFTRLISGGGAIGFGFVASWIFGREYSDHTAKDLLALPVSRASIISAKFIFMTIWCALLIVIMFVVGLFSGFLTGLPGWSGGIFTDSIHTFVVTAALMLLLCTITAFLASWSRGYLLPMGFVVLMLMMSQLVGAVGLGPYFPWALPQLYVSAAASEGTPLTAISYIILCVTSIIGLLGTFAWWKYADQS